MRFSPAPTIKRHGVRVIEFFLLLAALCGFTPAIAGALTGADLVDSKLTLHFDGPVGAATSFALDGPRRIAVDIAGAEPRAPGPVSDALVNSIRIGRPGNGVMRVVIDLSGPATINDILYSPDARDVTLTIGAATLDQFAQAVRAGSQALGMPGAPGQQAVAMGMAERLERRYSVSVPIGTAAQRVGLPRISGPNNPALPLVVIDAGHGGHDPGALSPDRAHRESDITLAIARAVRDSLVASGRVRVALTRDSDRFLVLEERYGIARRLGADLFISVHADAAENTSATGAAIYTLSEVASDREAARLAARENRANILNGVDLGGQNADVRSILIDLTQRETMNLSSDFARTLQRTAGPDIPFRNASHRFAGFVVLKAPDMPSVLLETGFITNDTDAARIASAAGQRSIARGIRQAVLTHFARQIARAGTEAGGRAMAAR